MICDRGPRTAGPLTNMDPETGIRYGVIGTNDVDPGFLEEIYINGVDLDYQELIDNIAEELTTVLEPYGADSEAIDRIISDLDLEWESVGRFHYEVDGLVVMIDRSNDLWIFKSPVTGLRGLCSPCAPGACHLKSEGEYECYILPEELIR